MRKVWTYKRKGIKGWWVGWYEGGKRKSKALPNKALAEHYKKIKYQQLNSDVFTSTINITWPELKKSYKNSKHVAGLKEVSIYEAMNTLNKFEELVGKPSSKQLTQVLLDKFVKARLKEVKRYTVNKDISNLRAFVHWGQSNRYMDAELKLKKVKVEDLQITILNATQIKELLTVAHAYPGWPIRILLALTTGLRKGDIEKIRISDLHFDRSTIATRSKKTGKAMGERPVPARIMTEISNYLSSLPDGAETLWQDTHTHKRWKAIRNRAGLADLKFHDLRKTFASTLAHRGVSSAVTQRLLEHSSSDLTNKIYTNVDPVLSEAVGRLPVDEWL